METFARRARSPAVTKGSLCYGDGVDGHDDLRSKLRSDLDALSEDVTLALSALKKARRRLKSLRNRLQALREGVDQLSLLDTSEKPQ